MAAENDFLWFASGVGANVETQANYAADPAVIVGNSPGLARSAIFNKSWRQGSAAAALLGQFIANQGLNAIDDGNLSALLTNFENALGVFLSSVTAGSPNGISRRRLQANEQYWVNPGGSDANPGTSALPWATLQHAANYLVSSVDFVGLSAQVNCSGAFTSGMSLTGSLVGAAGPQSLIFNFAAGSSVIVSNMPAFLAQIGAQFTIQGSVQIQSTSGAATTFGYGNGVYSNVGGYINIGSGGVNFGGCAVSQMQAVGGGSITLNGSYGINGGAPAHLSVASGGTFGFGSVVVTLTGTPAFTSFAQAQTGGDIAIPSSLVSFSGGATGSRYLVVSNGIINTSGGGANFLPGNAAGVIGTPPGLYL